jgi:hypothetical protein
MRWSVMMDGAYRTPLGDVPVDPDCASALRERCPFLEPDGWAQRGEHAVEVLLPMLQRLGPPGLTVVPIVTGSEELEEFGRLAAALAQVIRMQEEPVLLLASTDLSHYQPRGPAEGQDRALLAALTALDGDGLIRAVREQGILMCGYAAAACVVEAAKQLGATRSTLAAYGTSADAGGDPGSVTGYAGLIIA